MTAASLDSASLAKPGAVPPLFGVAQLHTERLQCYFEHFLSE